MYWACVQTESQREHVAERWLREQRFEVYLPRIRIERHSARANGHGLPTSATAPLFPAYLFVSIVDRWYSIGSTIGVIDVLRDGEHPAHVPEPIISALKARERDGVVVLETRPAFLRGDRVRIMRGALQGQLAIFQDMKPRQRAEILLSILGASRSVVLKRRDIRRLNGLA